MGRLVFVSFGLLVVFLSLSVVWGHPGGERRSLRTDPPDPPSFAPVTSLAASFPSHCNFGGFQGQPYIKDVAVVWIGCNQGTGADCPSDWSSYEGHCYRVFQQEMTWDDAEKFCTQQHQKSHPVYFRSSEEVDFLVSILKFDLFWMGWRDIWNERRLQWSDGTKVNYKAWSAEPECVVCRATDNQWFSTSCSKTHNVICKF